MLGLFISLTTLNLWNLIFAQRWVDGITNSRDCINGMWKWCFSFDNLVHWSGSQLAKTNKNRTVMTIVQDVIFAATYIVWAVLTIIIIYCGLGYIFAARGGNTKVQSYKTWLINAGIWAVLVRWAYAIVRLIQYIAKW